MTPSGYSATTRLASLRSLPSLAPPEHRRSLSKRLLRCHPTATVHIILTTAAAAVPTGFLIEDAQAANRGGHLRMGFHAGSTSDSLQTELLTSEFTNMLFFTILGHLTEVAPDGQLVSQAAESIEPNATADEWTFTLRKGIEFHNGKTLDADDVIA